MIKANKEYYSPSRKGFFPGSMYEQYKNSINGWPEDALELEEGYKEELFNKQSLGYEIKEDGFGYPVAVEVVISARERNESRRDSLIIEVDHEIRPLLGYALSGVMDEPEKERFQRLNKYRKALENIDVSIDNVEWPEKPE